MQDPTMVSGGGGTDPNAGSGGTDPNAGGGGTDPNAGGAGAPEEQLSTQQMVDGLAKVLGADAEGVDENQEFRIRQEARNQITDLQSSISDELPDATRSQVNQMVAGWVNNDPVKVINAIRDAMKVEEEKQTNARRTNARDLKVQGTGNGKGGETTAPRNMSEAIVNASRMFSA